MRSTAMAAQSSLASGASTRTRSLTRAPLLGPAKRDGSEPQRFYPGGGMRLKAGAKFGPAVHLSGEVGREQRGLLRQGVVRNRRRQRAVPDTVADGGQSMSGGAHERLV